jgi:DNA topoisomerase-1
MIEKLTSAEKEMRDEAHDAGLRYTSDEQPGITRQARGKSFVYVGPDGKQLRDKKTLGRIKALSIPPAWKKVWISEHERGHLQATGRDARGRKQYRYHSYWRQQRDETKYQHTIAFAGKLPKIRRRVAADLRRAGFGRAKILATIVRLLETSLIRVGNEDYARENHSFGLTTLRNRHAKVRKSEITFSFRGKSGKHHDITLHDPRLAKIVRACQDMPGQELFSYIENGEVRHVDSADINSYLREITGGDFTAKDFRTWVGTVLAATAFREFEVVTSPAQAKKNIGAVIGSVARMLGNTPAVCRKCYVHPEVINAYLSGETIKTVTKRISTDLKSSNHRLQPMEAAVLALLQRRLKRSVKRQKAIPEIWRQRNS